MNFAAPMYLFGTLLAALFAAIFIAGALSVGRAAKVFGDKERIASLLTSDPSKRRAWKAVLIVVATALVFVAAARPQYGKGTRLVPATNLDVVIVLDYSKSMYARDVAPSRIFRAKVEVARLIKELEGARFGAVSFAGEPMGFPLTADGAAIAQFLRRLDPNDMPVGGTAIARALDQARELLNRDPKSAEHKRVVVLITDGEDLEGDPVSVAQALGQEGTTVHVVQIGGRTPERIPEVGPDGEVVGWRKDRQGKLLTTALSAQGEAQLGSIAAATPGGQVIRAEKGSTGIDAITTELKRQMKSELAERVETVYADIYFYPLGLAILLLAAEVFLAEAKKRLPFAPAFFGEAAPGEAGGSLRIALPNPTGMPAHSEKMDKSPKGKKEKDISKAPEDPKDVSPWASFPPSEEAKVARASRVRSDSGDVEARRPKREKARRKSGEGDKP